MSRTMDDLPPIASDDELVEWGRQLTARPTRPNRPLYATRTTSTSAAGATASTSMMSTEELFLDISERAAAAYSRKRIRVTVRR